MNKTFKTIFTVLSIIGGIGAIGEAGFEIVDKVGDLKKLNKEKVNAEVPEVKEA